MGTGGVWGFMGGKPGASPDWSRAAPGWPCHGAAPSFLGEHAARPAAPAVKAAGKAAILTLSRDFEPSAHFCQLAER